MSRLPPLDADDLLVRARKAAASYAAQGWTGRDGEELYRALAEVFAALLARIVDRWEGAYLERATGAISATGALRVTWTAGTTDGVGVATGQVIAKTPWGVTFALAGDLTAGDSEAPSYSQLVDVVSVYGDEEGNLADGAHLREWALPTGPSAKGSILWVAGQGEDGKDEFLDGVADGSITVAGEGDFVNGSAATLDLIAMGRGLPRAEDEPDDELRRRVRKVPETCTPNAIVEAVELKVRDLGVAVALVEPWDYAWTVGDSELGTIGDGGICPIDHRPAFVVLLDDVPYADEAWTVGDDPLGTIGDPEYAIGLGHTYHDGIIAGVQALVDEIKGAGIDGRVAEGVP